VQRSSIYNVFSIDFAIKMSSLRKQLLVATGNAGKLSEYRRLLADSNIEVIGLHEFENIAEVEESGASFDENARLKAIGYARQTAKYALADDSGLEVAALDGRPGVHSARYLGEVTFEYRMDNIISELSSNNLARDARFVCSIAIADPDGNICEQVEGICAGEISKSRRGSNGFGYDPIFIPNGSDQTFGELCDDIKNEISHRSIALNKIIPKIRGILAL
jgi:XTP/dITP diphosphohydrolase